MGGAIPDRWLDYKPIGKRIEGTRFIAFKVPLRKHVNGLVEEASLRLDADMLLEQIPNLGFIIDLTNTNRYYSPECFTNAGVKHQKLMIPGKQTPSDKLATEFKYYVMDFLNLNKNNDKLIGVHCTHGVNRTGYLICNYMISEMRMGPKEAIQKFISARGHQIERQNYVQALHNLNTGIYRRSNDESSHNNRIDSKNAKNGYNGRETSNDFISKANDGSNRQRSGSNSVGYGFKGPESSNSFRSKDDNGNQRYRSGGSNAGHSFKGPESLNAFRSKGDDGGNHRYRSGGNSSEFGFKSAESSNAFGSNGNVGNQRYRGGGNSAEYGFKGPESLNAFGSNGNVGNQRYRNGGNSAEYGFKGPESLNAFGSNGNVGNQRYRSGGNSVEYGFKGPESSNAFRSQGDEGNQRYRSGGSNAGYGFKGPESSNAFGSQGDEGNQRNRSGGSNAGYGFKGPESSNAFRSNRDEGNHSFRRVAVPSSSWHSTGTNTINNFRGGNPSYNNHPSYEGNGNRFKGNNSNYSTNYHNDKFRTSRKWIRSDQQATESQPLIHSPMKASRGLQDPYNPDNSRKQFHRPERSDSSSNFVR